MYPDETERIEANLPKVLPLLRPEAQSVVLELGFLSRRRKAGTSMLRVVNGWCVFFNNGCVLHRVGAEEGDKFRYKPFICAVFPLENHARRGWYVRQKGLPGEQWDLFCLDPANSTRTAEESLADEVDLVERYLQDLHKISTIP